MADKPIIFSSCMVRAILDGRKTQTRRVLKRVDPLDKLRTSPFVRSGIETVHGREVRLPYAPGDRLWVREKHWCVELEGGGIEVPYLVYDEEWTTGPGARDPAPTEERPWLGPPYCGDEREIRWGARPSIHMPRWASRITLEVTEVRVQRLQEIDGTYDCQQEGIDVGALTKEGAILAFRDLWQSIHGPGSWEANPWVAAISFRPLSAATPGGMG